MYYKTFEDLPVWQKSRELVKNIFSLVENNKKLKTDYSLTDQLRRASYSMMLNIAEGFERGSNKDFAHFITIAKSSAGEVRSILYILLDNNYINQQDFEANKQKVIELSTNSHNFQKFLHINHRKR